MAPKRVDPARLLDRLTGARLCYGEPVVAQGRTVIPVSRVRFAGGGGWGRGAQDDGGGGGGGWFEAEPVGFVEVSASGSRYVEIPDRDKLQRTLRAGAAAVSTLAAGLAGARRLRGRGDRRPAGLLRR